MHSRRALDERLYLGRFPPREILPPLGRRRSAVEAAEHVTDLRDREARVLRELNQRQRLQRLGRISPVARDARLGHEQPDFLIVPDLRRECRVDVAAAIERSTAIGETERGVTLTFDGSDDTARLVTDLVLAERRCCAQFTYTPAFSPAAGAIELRVEAADQLIGPLKQLYLGLSAARRHG